MPEPVAGARPAAPGGPAAPRRPGSRRARRPDPLTPAQRAAAARAGGVGLALVSAGAAVGSGLLAASLVVAALRWAIIDLFDDEAWTMPVARWVQGLDASWLVPIVLVLVLLAVAAGALGCWLSARRLAAGGVPDPVGVTVRGAALGTGLQAVLTTASSWLLGLLVLLGGALAGWLVAALWIALSVLSSALIGWLAGPRTWAAIARRQARLAAPDLHVGGPPSA
ncbi:hypothetical protein OVA14_05310 [Agrococcus sp. SL85]|uniref:hypothetical protein n=1 Tax=Agrococcus sp. SL85 TaxID=2995141 RepID=UPI00226CCC6F|nr:hypothetical protein [Agrococcus sp. SL85]WAC67164.1 hypothetical protein OVA14_05310 [Agrococcus sp. SL85]